MPAFRHLRASLLAVAILATPMLSEARRLDADLEAMLPLLAPGETVEVVISFDQDGAPTAAQRLRLSALGLTGVTMRSLPIAGAVATPAQVRKLLAMDDVRSVWLNAPLDLENREATSLTGVDRLRTDGDIRVRGLPVSGRGIGVVVNDSGVDGTHRDIKYPNHVVQNVLAQTNLQAFDAMLPVTYVEGVADTDIGGGHGSHVAGIIGATGASSSPALAFEGVAPGARIVGYGSGAGLFILDTIGGFDYALTNQAQYDIRVVSNSFGNTGDVGTDFDPDDPTNIATKALADRNVVVVFSAGNAGSGEGTITGNFKKAPWVITVAAGDKQGGLADFSSRGEDGNGGTVVVDGEAFAWADRPTVTAPGVDIYSVRATTADPTFHAAIDAEAAEIGADNALYYTKLSGTSMAAPHISGVVALMLEANPELHWSEVKQILQDTATNIPGRDPWEAGAGYVNAYAAVQAALGAPGYGETVNASRDFNADAQVSLASDVDHVVDFSPVGPTGSVQFEVGPSISLVAARANVGENTVAISLTDPAGNRYGSSIALPVLGQNISATAPGMPGTWTLTVRGVGAVSGVDLDPANATNGYGLPGQVTVNVRQLQTDGYTGLGDVAGHPGQGFIEYGVSNRLVDGYDDGTFRPDAPITRGEMAVYLSMGNAVRQNLPFDGTSSFTDVPRGSALSPFAEGAASRGAALRDVAQHQAGVMGVHQGAFRPDDPVTRASLAYSLVQGLGLQQQAQGFASSSGTQTYTGTIGPSVENMEVHDIPVQVGDDVTTLEASLAWDAGVPAQDLDLYLLDPAGNQVASAATVGNPETVQYAVLRPGTYTWRITGYATASASYTLASTQHGTGGASEVTVLVDGERVPLEDAATIPASLRGYVQLALDLGLLNARFELAQGPFDLAPELKAWFDPTLDVTRAGYAAATARWHGAWLQ